MFSIKTFSTVLLAAAATVSAAPTNTAGTKTPTRTYELTGVTHSVVAGLGGLRFDPDNVVAEVGDISNFGNPCNPLADGSSFFSGFNFFTPEGQSANVFQIVVEDKKPIWYYCAQNAGQHCKNGMVGVINQNFDSPDFTLAKHKALAAQKGDAVIPPVQQGGFVIPNLNPLGGFKL
ncbi:extracellular serine-rich protein [Colletotrichum scovillei]|uniref:extracellular serine-rich protein n=1 Tax=Colletotrichum scovillei TaxID=1209932 RepID=UPI0015C342BC|nr:extracellular serine-rich protein [Colletotrichum scovillei]KAF4776469.1 extracellular serine-rich protein [Colletotrichum scovillei]